MRKVTTIFANVSRKQDVMCSMDWKSRWIITRRVKSRNTPSRYCNSSSMCSGPCWIACGWPISKRNRRTIIVDLTDETCIEQRQHPGNSPYFQVSVGKSAGLLCHSLPGRDGEIESQCGRNIETL